MDKETIKNKMNKPRLKTLKDIAHPVWKSDFDIDKMELRQAAIEWIKAFENGDCHTDFAADGRNGQENIEEWIKHFFNITEVELNGNK